MPREMRITTLLERYRQKLIKVLNDSLAWNIVRLPNNSLDLQVRKYCEEIGEVNEAEEQGDYQHLVEELADVLICIGGLIRFDEDIAQSALNDYLATLDKYIFMDVVDYAELKIPELYNRDYSDGYHHRERC